MNRNGEERIEVISGRALLATEYPPTEFVVDRLVPQGLTLMVSKSKVGKSWLAIGMAVGVANGGKVLGNRECKKGEVLYADLEQSPAKTKKRLETHLNGGYGQECPTGLYFTNRWPAMDRGALDFLADWIDQHPEAKLVVVDTVAKVWPAKMGGPGINAYYAEYQLLAQFKDLADSRGIALVLIHHQNKSNQDDELDTVSGTAAFVGVPDAIMVLKRKRGQSSATLRITGRDVDEQTLGLEFTPSIGTWSITSEEANEGIQANKALERLHPSRDSARGGGRR